MVSNHTAIPGATVRTSDGESIGAVKEIRGKMFKVTAPKQRDYWLDGAAIVSSDSSEVRLNFDKRHLGDYRLEGDAD